MNERIQPERQDQILSPQKLADIKLALAEYEQDQDDARQRRREMLLALAEQVPESSDVSNDSEREVIVGGESHDLSLLSQADRDEYLSRIHSTLSSSWDPF